MLAIFKQHEVFEYDPSRGRFRDWLAAVVRMPRSPGSFSPDWPCCTRPEWSTAT